jgi:hypothetical protein
VNALARRPGGPCACREPVRSSRVRQISPQEFERAARARVVREFSGRPHPRAVSERPRSHRGTEPVILAGKPGSKCRPFLTVHKDDEKFAACNALADEIGPLNDPKKVFRLLEEAIGDELSEVFGVMTLDLHGRLKGMTNTGMGEASSVMAPMIPTLRAALLSGGGGSILYHCHPSGIDAQPSQADIDTTEAFDEAFEAIGMPLIDHVIVAGSTRKRSFFSFAKEGLL